MKKLLSWCVIFSIMLGALSGMTVSAAGAAVKAGVEKQTVFNLSFRLKTV